MRRPNTARRPLPLRAEPLEDRCTPATITVTTAADDLTPDDGTVSLREAIAAINAGNDLGDLDVLAHSSGIFGAADAIHFDIPGSGVHTIFIGSALPLLMKPLTVDGYTQPGAAPNTLAVGDDATILVEIDGGGTQSAFLDNPGATLDGTTIRGLSLVDFGGAAIGFDSGSTTSNAVIEGNFIGVRPDGVTKRANATGVFVENPHGTGGFRIGGTDPAQRNVISGNTNDGIWLNVADSTVQGNYVGTDASGTTAIPNGAHGIELRQGGNLIGGTAAGAGNVLSGNGRDGLYLFVNANNTVQGNLVGLSADGTAAVGNTQYGVEWGVAGGANLVGGDTAAARNVISGNGLDGVFIDDQHDQTVQGNFIGTDATGTTAVPNGGDGLRVTGTGGNSILGNVVSGNVLDGMSVASGDVVQGNIVGADASGANPLPNGRNGISAPGSALIGGTAAGQGNVIAFNTQDGVQVTFVGVRVLGNSIYSNGGLGIDLVNGGNNAQPAPSLTSAAPQNGGVHVAGSLTSAPGVYRVEFFASAAADPSGFGEGQVYLGFTSVTIDASGTASFTADVAAPPAGLGSSPVVTATATNQSTNDTSAFSNATALPTTPVLAAVADALGNVVVLDANTGAKYLQFRPFDTAANRYTGQMSVALGDVNHDGVADLIVATRGRRAGKVKVFDGAGIVAGSVTLPTQTILVAFPVAGYKQGLTVSAADVDGDGAADVAVATRTAASVTTGALLPATVVVYAGTTAGAGGHLSGATLGSFQPIGTATDGVYVAAGDVTGDGKAEVAISSSSRSMVKVFTRTNGVFTQLGSTIGNGTALVPGDGDGQLRALMTGGSAAAVAGALNPSTGAVGLGVYNSAGQQVSTYTVGTGATFFAIDALDLNGDGNDRLMLARVTPGGGTTIDLLDPLTGTVTGTLNGFLPLAGKVTIAGAT